MGGKGEILDIKVDDIKAAAPQFSRQGIALGNALTRLKASLAAVGTPWGDDEQGRAFHHVTQIEHSTRILVDGLTSIHKALTDMADRHIDNEELVRGMFSRIHADRTAAPGDGK
jgi:uncharacterized protein YukE